MKDSSALAKSVQEVFLVPPDFPAKSAELVNLATLLEGERRTVAESFLNSLRGVVSTLTIPFNYTYAQVHSLQWQRFLMAGRIRARSNPKESEREVQARAEAQAQLKEFVAQEAGGVIADEVLNQLDYIKAQPESLAAARELMRQGVVLIWSAFEVLARDLFVDLLNGEPALLERLLSHPAAKKRFGVEKIDWQTLARFDYDLSSSIGSLLIERTDIDDIQTIREAYGALYPNASRLANALGSNDLWFLFQKRNLIVHRRGIVDAHYLAKTGDSAVLGDTMWVQPVEVERFLSTVTVAGTTLLATVQNAG
jgi:hypothetical protein